MKTRNETTVGAAEKPTSGGRSQLTFCTIGMRLYKKQDLDGSNYPNESSEAIQPNQQEDRLPTVNMQSLSLAQWTIKHVQQKCTCRVGEIQRNVDTATLPYQLFNALYKQSLR